MKNKIIRPPRLAEWIIKRLGSRVEKHSVADDLAEEYVKVFSERGRTYSWSWYNVQVMKAAPIFLIYSFIWSLIMAGNYLKISVRNLMKHKGYSFINITGLAAGMAVCLLIMTYVRFELSYDNFHANVDRIYRVPCKVGKGDNVRLWGWATPLLSVTLKNDYPEVVQSTRLYPEGRKVQVTYKDKKIMEDKVLFADSEFFKVFTFPLLKGSPDDVLKNPNSVVLTRQTAEKYFGSEDPVGKTISIQSNWINNPDFMVTGVSENVPRNSHFNYDFLISFNSSRLNEDPVWKWGWLVFTYILLDKNSDPALFDSKLQDIVKNYFEIPEEKKGNYRYFLQPLRDIHLKSNLEQELGRNRNVTYVYMFSIIAVIILLAACVNFMNLSTARAANRAKEVGVRKVVGSFKRQLVGQFLFESVFISFISLITAVGLVELLLPFFNTLTGHNLEIGYFQNYHILPGLILFSLAVGLLAGSYPAFFLSSFKPAAVLKGSVSNGVKKGFLRNILVVFQFTVSIALISGTVVVKKQIDFMLGRDPGFDKENVLVIENGEALGPQLASFKNEIKNNVNVKGVAGSWYYPVRSPESSTYSITGSPGTKVSMFNTNIGYDFIKTLNLELSDGRNFRQEIASDTAALILNESAVKAMGLTDPVGKHLTDILDIDHHIIGVVKDFNFKSMHHNIGPLVFFPYPGNTARYISVRLRPEDLPGTLAAIKKTWNNLTGGAPFDYSYLDQNMENLYSAEAVTGRLAMIFSVIAIMIGCLGLFGLAAYMAKQKTKEIGIRKVLGSTVSGIVLLLSGRFIKWVLIANIFAWPVSWFFMNRWLQNFAFRTEMPIWIFIAAGFLAVVIALLTVGCQAVKAANTNPVKALKYE